MSNTVRLFLFASLVLCHTGTISGHASEEARIKQASPSTTSNTEDKEGNNSKLLIGVREHARPFSFRTETRSGNYSSKSGPLRSKGYDGYMVYICDEVLKEMFISDPRGPEEPFGPEDIEHIDVDELLRQNPKKQDRIDFLESEIDILCDPATITRDRVKRYAVSPPLFVTGIGYLQLKNATPPDLEHTPGPGRALIGLVGATTSRHIGLQAILNSGEWSRFREKIITAMRSDQTSKIRKKQDIQNEKEGTVIWPALSHEEVSKAFCDNVVTYYVGDLEIITDYARQHAGCEWTLGATTYTNDRYAIFANIDYRRNKGRKAHLIGRFYEILNREIATADSLLDRAYRATFGDAPRSRQLELFYWSMRGSN
ncbi:hypothetical protein [Coralliovum pocilloporae]|uniref:hypothetical protein n=1 Tax=Coralliovum pocilloporae TaxID=3066369 RepID=UPI0033075EB0